jgi:CubicO group peptidase (beta-lactamase class C family)
MSYKKIILYVCLLAAVISNLAIIITGKTYLYSVMLHNFAKIDDYIIFPNRPVATGDPQPWKIAPGYNRRQLNPATETFIRSEMKSVAFVVIHNDAILFEKYWDGYGTQSKSSSFSMAKSIMSILIGIALQEGKLTSVDQRLGDILPQYSNTDKAGITIKNLLTMSSGLDYRESYNNPFADSAESYHTADLSKQAMKLRRVSEPGKVFNYQSCNQIYLAQILEKVTGMKTSYYASEKLWKPIGAEHPATWSLDRVDGLEKAYCCFNSNARDFARIGFLYLNRGKWNNRQIVPEQYVRESTTPADIKDEKGIQNNKYGYSWWLINHRNHSIFFASGILGQHIIVVPDKKLIIVRLGKKYFTKTDSRYRDDLKTYIDAALDLVSRR